MVTAGTAASGGAGRSECWRGAARLLAVGCLALWGSAAPAWAAPTVAQMLNFTPRQKGVGYATPAAEEQEKCKVELMKGATKGSGWLLRDPNGKVLRIFFDTNGYGKPNVWSYFKDGAEVYREVDSTYAGRPDQYRWLNAGGMKWGLDADRDGRIESWKAISPEEVSQELLQALIARDAARFQALLLTEAELKALELPADQAGRIRDSLKAAAARFEETATKLSASLTAKANWIHLETQAPQCLPADQGGARSDLVKYTAGTILFENAGKNEWVQTGEIVQVGAAWRLAEGPAPGATTIGAAESTGASPAALPLIEKLTALDKDAPPASDAA